VVVAVGEGISVSATASDVAERRKSDTIALAFIASVSGHTTCERVSMERSSAKHTSGEEKQVETKIWRPRRVCPAQGSQSRVQH